MFELLLSVLFFNHCLRIRQKVPQSFEGTGTCCLSGLPSTLKKQTENSSEASFNLCHEAARRHPQSPHGSSRSSSSVRIGIRPHGNWT